MKSVKRSELSNVKMIAGNENKHPIIILDGWVKDWIGFGWIDIREATYDDLKKYPIVKD